MSAIFPAHLNNTHVAIIGEALSEEGMPHSALRTDDHLPWNLEWYFDDNPSFEALNTKIDIVAAANDLDLADRLDWHAEDVPDINWLEHCYEQFQPFYVGPFFIYGSHFDGVVPDGQMGLQIDAATAFGSGEHGTTKGCLQAMLDLKGQGACPWNVLDMGCGSGILAIAAYMLWKTPVMAVDNDPESIAVTERHAASNNVPIRKGDFQTLVNEGFDGGALDKKGPFDLILANILAPVLKDLAPAMANISDENGFLILSGILNEQVDGVLDVYEPLGFALKKRIEIGEWSTLILQNSAA